MLRTERVRRTVSVSSTMCPICGGTHEFDFRALIEQVVGVMHMMTSHVESRTCWAQCPTNGGQFVVDVEVTLWSGQTLLQLS